MQYEIPEAKIHHVPLKVATIVPLSHLDSIKGDHYFMALSLAADNVDYLNFFRDRSEEGKHVILDNSAVELGQPENFNIYYQKALEMKATTIMLPDIFKESGHTRRECEKFMHRATVTTGMAYGTSVMAIPQGKNLHEWMESAQDLERLIRSYKMKPVIGISYRYNYLFGPRNSAYFLLSHYMHIDTKIHFLGCSLDPRREIAPVIRFPNVAGVDSSYPTIYTQQSIRMVEDDLARKRPPREIDFLADQYDVDLLEHNVEIWREACLTV